MNMWLLFVVALFVALFVVWREWHLKIYKRYSESVMEGEPETPRVRVKMNDKVVSGEPLNATLGNFVLLRNLLKTIVVMVMMAFFIVATLPLDFLLKLVGRKGFSSIERLGTGYGLEYDFSGDGFRNAFKPKNSPEDA